MNQNSRPELISLTVEGIELDAQFSPEIKEYWAAVPFDIDSAAILAEAEGDCYIKCN